MKWIDKILLCILMLGAETLVAQNYNISNSSVSTCSGNFYDSGGNGGPYGNGESFVMTFCSSVAGECVRLNFSAFNLEAGFDFLTVYNGPNTGSPVLGVFSGNALPPLMTATTGCLTIEFTSDITIVRPGFEATISCVPCPGSACPSCNGGAPPANDACSGAQNLGALPAPAVCPNGVGAWANFNTTNICATAESPYTTLIGCQPTGNMASPASDVWYRFTITGPTLNISIAGMQTPNIGLYAGIACNNLVGRGCAVGGGGILNTSFGGLAPGTYYLQVSGGNLNDQCAFTLSLQNNYDCSGCVIQSSFTANPAPVNGTYTPGQTVTFCYTITDYNQTSSNWLHAVTPTFGAGWDMPTLSTNPATTCGTGNWAWYNNTVTSTATGLVTGPGFFFESGLGSPSGNMDGNPGNNFGDNNPANLCDWTFCWTVTTLPPALCVAGTSLNITVDTYGDGESGSWTSVACMGDPVSDFFATLNCCEPPQVAVINPLCNGQNNGSATASGQGIAPWDYVWKNGGGTTIQTANNINGSNSINNLAPGNYSVTATDNAGCTASVNFTITAPPVLQINIVPVPAGCNGASDGSATSNVLGGTGAYQYIWAPSGGTAATETGLAAGTYTVTVTDDNGCTLSAQIVINQSPPLVVNSVTVNALCGQSNGSVTVNVVGGTGALQYSIDGGATFQAGNTFLNLAAANYNVVATDANGCTGVDVAQVNNSVAPAITTTPIVNVLCNGGSNGSITINANGGTGALQYSIDNGGTFQANNVFNNLPAGNYDIVVIDANGCQITTNVIITEPSVVVVNLAGNDPICGLNNGSITAAGGGGTGAYQFSIDGGGFQASNIFNNLGTGNHTVTVSDANGCTGIAALVLNTAPPLVPNSITTTATCGNDNGSITANAVGGTVVYSFSINGGAFGGSGIFNNLFPGNYNVTVQDANGCSVTVVIVVADQPGPVINNSNANDVTCFAGTDGIVNVTANGGTAPVQFSLNGGAFQANGVFNNLPAGNYTVTAQDANNCTSTTNVVVNEPTEILAVGNSVNSTCSNANGSLSLNANGGTGALQYSLNGGANQAGNAFNNLMAGNYTVTVTDANGCTVDVPIAVIDEPSPVITTAPATIVSCNGGNDGTITVNANGGTGVIQYSIDNGTTFQAGNTFNNLTAANYTVLISDANGCTATFNTQVTEPAAVAAATVTAGSTCSSNNGDVTINANGGTGAYQYSINGGANQASNAFAGLLAGNYSYIVTDANGCTYTDNFVIADAPGPVVTNTANTLVTCFGGNDGSVSVTINSGTAPILFSLNGGAGQASGNFNNLAAGNYTVDVTDANGCTTTTNIVVNEPPVLQGVGNSVNSTCSNANGSLSVNANGGTGALQYSLNGGAQQAGNAFNNLMAGNYTVTVTDANGCTVDVPIAVIDEPSPVITTAPATIVSCNGGNDGTITVNANGGTGAIQYSIDNGTTFQAGNTFNNLTAANYTVLISDANGCTATFNTQVTEPAAVAAATVTAGSTCSSNNGDVTINANGGTGAYQYSINGGANQASNAFAGLLAGNYSYIVTDANGCTYTDNFVIADAPGPVVTNTANTLVTCFGGNDGSVSVTINSGTAPILFSLNGGAGQASGNFNNLAAGNYTVDVTDANGCTTTTNIVVNEPPVLQGVGNSVNSTCSNANGSLSVNANGGTGALQYSLNGGAQQAGNAFNNLMAGNYTVTVTDANGCTVDVPIAVIDEPSPVITTAPATIVSCNGGNDGTITVNANGGTGVIQYSIDNGTTFQAGNTFNNLIAGNYTVLISDANGCTATFNTQVTEPAAVAAATVTAGSTCSSNNGDVTINANGGTGAYQYSINGGANQASNAFAGLLAGNYSYIVTDANGCTYTDNFDIIDAPGPTAVTDSVNDALCFNQSDGDIYISITGGTLPNNFLWSDGTTTQDITNIPAGTYTVTVTDANGCTFELSFLINEPPVLQGVGNSVNSTCSNANGSLSVNANGGTGALQYSLNGGANQAGNAFNNLMAGNYTVTVTDANGCTVDVPIAVIDEPSPVITTAPATLVSCNGGNDGTITVNSNGGTGAIQYSIDNGTTFQAGNTFNNLTAGNYTVLIADANGCIATFNTQVTEPTVVAGNANVTLASCGNNDGSATVIGNGGTGAYQYSINNGVSYQASGTFNNLLAGNYDIIVMDANGCTATVNTAIGNTAAPVISSTPITDLTCFNSDDGIIIINTNGGTAPLTFSIDNGTTFLPVNNFSNLPAGNYDIVVEDALGCQATLNVVINEPPQLTFNTQPVNTTCGQSNGSITVTANGGTGAYSYSNNGGTSQQPANTFNNIPAANYPILVTDANGCTATANVVLNDTPGPVIQNVISTDIDCNGATNGQININANGGTGGLQYSIDNGITFQASDIFNNLAPGNYDVVVTDANNCTTISNATIIQPPALVINTNSTTASCGNSDGSLTVNVNGGTGAIQFSIDNGITFQPIGTFNSIPAGNYDVVVQDANGCTASTTGTVNNAAAPSITATASTDITCFGDDDGTITITANGGTGIIQYSINNGVSFQAGNSFNNLAPGTYDVVVEDVNGCQATSVMNLIEPPQLIVATVETGTTCGQSNGSVVINANGGTGVYTFSTNGGSTSQAGNTFNNMIAGNYNIVVTDANGCTATSISVIQDAPGPNIQNIAVIDITCNGADNGQLTINANGGTGALQFSIDNGITFVATTVFNNLAPGNYSIVVTDANGCSETSLGVVAEPSAVLFAVVETPASCGNSDGTLTINANGGTGAYQFSIDNGVTFQPANLFNSLPAGNYSIIVQDANGCTSSAVGVVNNAAAPVISATAFTDVTCFGDNNGTITITANGGTGVLQYSIDNGATYQASNIFNNLPPGTYDLIAEDVNGCQAADAIVISEPLQLSAAFNLTNTTCSDNNGSVDVNASGGTGIIEYSINNGTTYQASAIFGNLLAGNYTITLQDANGCTTSYPIALIDAPGPAVQSVNTTDISCNGADDGSLIINANGGTTPLSYSIDNGTTVQPAALFSNLTPGNYNIVVTDANGCSTVSQATIIEPASINASFSSTTASCGNADGGITVNANGGSGTLEYSIDNGVSFQSSINFTSLPAGSYTIIVQDDNGCSTTVAASVSNAAAPAIQATNFTEITCNGDDNGTITINASGGTGALLYSINNGVNTQPGNSFTGLSPGIYNIVVTDVNGCSATSQITLTEPTLLTASSTSITATCGNANGEININAQGGTGLLEYSNNGGTTFQAGANFNNLAQGNYNIIVTDANGCTFAMNSAVPGAPGPVLSAVFANDLTCFGSNDGLITIVANGGTPPLQYSIDNGVTFVSTISFGSLSMGNYSIVISDANGCTTSSAQNLQQPDEVIFSTVVVDATCGNSDGGITLNASGGSGTYNYSIDNGTTFQPSNIFNTLPAGTYQAVVRDASDCTSAAPVNINNIAAPVIQGTPLNDVSCNGLSDGSITINVTGGTPPLSYSIDGGFTWQPSNLFSNLPAGNLNIVVSDGNGCDVTATASIVEPNPIVLNAASTTATCGNNDGTVTIGANGGSGILNFSLNGGPLQQAGVFNNLTAGNYNIVVTDASGCSGTIVASVSNTNSPVISSVNSTNITCFGSGDGTINISANGGTGTLNYSINNGTSFQPSGNYSNLGAGTYSIMVEDASGCVATSNIIITEPDELVLNTLPQSSTCGNQNGEIQTLVSGGTGTLLYSINNGASTQPAGTFTNLNQGSYTILVTDANGCSASAAESVNNIPGPSIASIPLTNSNCFNSDDGSVNINLTGGTGPFQYSINGGASQMTGYFGGLAPLNYTLLVTDANGCTVDSVVALTEPTIVTIASTVINSTCSINNGEISITGNGGTGTITYSIDGGLSFQPTAGFINLLAGNYTIQVQDANGCTAASSAIIIDAPAPQVQSSVPSDISCNGAADGQIIISTTGGTLPLQYSIDNGATYQASSNFTNLGPGVFTIMVVDANGCSVSGNATISEPAAIITAVSSTSALCNGSGDGTATIMALGGTAPYSYIWSNGFSGQATAPNLAAGIYTVTVTDANGCSTLSSTTVAEPSAIMVTDSSTDISCFGFTDGYIILTTAGGTAPYTYNWSSGALSGHENDNLAAGTYTVTINDANGCTTTQSFSVVEPAAIALSSNAIDVSCFGFSDGTSSVIANGGTSPFTYQWSNNSITATANSLPAGTYTVTVTDDNGCTAETSEVVGSPSEITSSTTTTDVTCNGFVDGTASVIVNGGTAPYSYLWSNGGTTGAITNIDGGTFTVSITDANNCLASASVFVDEPTPIVVNMTGATILCIGQSAVISATAQGGNGGYTFNWSNGVSGSSQTVNPAVTTSYNVNVTDSLGCPAAGTALLVTVNPALALTISQPDTICEGSTVHISTVASGGDGGPYTYNWVGLSQTTSQLNVTPAVTTTYMVTVSDGCGTPAVNSAVEIVVNPLPVVNFVPIPAEGCVPLEVSFDNTTITATTGATYEWFFGDNSGSTVFEPVHLYTEAGFYTVVLKVVSAEGCPGQLTINDAVKVYPVPKAAIGASPPLASILHPIINFTDEGYGASWWSWDFGDNSAGSDDQNPVHSYAETGIYPITLYVMNDYGCRDTANYEVVIEGTSTVYIPNAFSPNNDGRNDTFQVFGVGLTDVEMSIFNRWGNKIFVSADLNRGWDGFDSYAGSECPQGVYVYLVRVKNFKGETVDYTGRVTLVR